MGRWSRLIPNRLWTPYPPPKLLGNTDCEFSSVVNSGGSESGLIPKISRGPVPPPQIAVSDEKMNSSMVVWKGSVAKIDPNSSLDPVPPPNLWTPLKSNCQYPWNGENRRPGWYPSPTVDPYPPQFCGDHWKKIPRNRDLWRTGARLGTHYHP